MKELKILEQIAINNANFNTYQAMTFDGEFYYFSIEGKKTIDIYDLKFNKVKICNVGEEYGCITYNSKHKCFYAIPKYNADLIVKLNKNMCQIGWIDISGLLPCDEICITSITYSCSDDSIIISTKNKIFKISIKCNSICEIFALECDLIIKVISVEPGYIIITEQTELYQILIYDCNFKIIKEQCLKKCNTLCDAILNPCDMFCNNKCEQYATVYLLMNQDRKCSKIYQVPIYYDEFGYDLCECNFQICKKIPKPCKEISKSCLIETIALIQASIAHILNAEGEKIQKIVATSNNIQEILCVNKEVEQMIVKITHLELVLYDFLVELNNCDGSNCCSKCNDFCCDKDNKCLCDVDGGKL